jgi:hypothetical protein
VPDATRSRALGGWIAEASSYGEHSCCSVHSC